MPSLAATTLVLIGLLAPVETQSPPAFDAISARVDPYVEKSRVVVMTDIANEPDDQMSMVRFLVYANNYDVEGLIASTSTWMRNKVRPDVIHTLIDAYAQVFPTLSTHEPGFPAADALRTLVVSGQPGYGMAAVGADKRSAGADLIVRAAERPDPRPLWVLAWGGANTLAQALLQARVDALGGTARCADLEASRLRDLRSGRRRSLDSKRIPGAPLHRDPVHP